LFLVKEHRVSNKKAGELAKKSHRVVAHGVSERRHEIFGVYCALLTFDPAPSVSFMSVGEGALTPFAEPLTLSHAISPHDAYKFTVLGLRVSPEIDHRTALFLMLARNTTVRPSATLSST